MWFASVGVGFAQNTTPDQFDIEPDLESPAVGFFSTDWLALSGEVRERASYVSDVEYDPNNPDNGWFWTQRLALNGDFTFTPNFRGRVSLLSAVVEGIDANPLERNLADVQEGYLEWGNQNGYLRVGRQVAGFGSARLVSNRNGTNVKRVFDGIRGHLIAGDGEVDAFALREVRVEPEGVFNDRSDNGSLLTGIYATTPAPLGSLDVYYLYSEFDNKRTIENIADQQRHSVGVRSFGERGNVFWNWEAVYQFGDQGDLDIAAWTLATNTGYRWLDAPWEPEFLLSTNISSGDKRQGDGELNTFDALYPRGNYFSQLVLLGPSNFFNFHPIIKMHPREEILLFFDVNFYWRMDTDDGIYGPVANLIRPGDGSDARHVDTSISGGIEWEFSEGFFMSALFTHAMPGDFIEDTGPSASIDFFELTFEYQF